MQAMHLLAAAHNAAIARHAAIARKAAREGPFEAAKAAVEVAKAKRAAIVAAKKASGSSWSVIEDDDDVRMACDVLDNAIATMIVELKQLNRRRG